MAQGLSACCRTRLLFFYLVCFVFYLFWLTLPASDSGLQTVLELWRTTARAPLSLDLLPRLKCVAHVQLVCG